MDSTLSAALKEAYASAPSNVVIYHTLELNHVAFTAPIRVVRDYSDLTATLEASAPFNPSASVTFTAFNFDFTKPEVSPANVPQLTITLDNVSQLIVQNLELAMLTTDVVTAIYREYISTDLTGPQNDPPIHMNLISVQVDVFKVKATAGFTDLTNRRFPTKAYDAQTFPGLVL